MWITSTDNYDEFVTPQVGLFAAAVTAAISAAGAIRAAVAAAITGADAITASCRRVGVGYAYAINI